jgi:transmembrane protein 222
MNQQWDSSTVKPPLKCCLVWAPIPIVSWFLPFIGHTGITDSRGIIFDWSGSGYAIGVDNFYFGSPTTVVQLDKMKCHGQDWDSSVKDTCDKYVKMPNLLFWENCHSFCSYALNRMAYDGRTNLNMFTIGFWLWFHGQVVGGYYGYMRIYLPFATVCCVLMYYYM